VKDEQYTTITVNIITINDKTKAFRINVDGDKLEIPIGEALFANYINQFYRKSPSDPQRHRHSTLMALVRAAYLKGVSDGKSN
jgi:hypothetical protein